VRRTDDDRIIISIQALGAAATGSVQKEHKRERTLVGQCEEGQGEGGEWRRYGRRRGNTHEFWSTFLPQTRHPLSSNMMLLLLLPTMTTNTVSSDVLKQRRMLSKDDPRRFCGLERLFAGSRVSNNPNGGTEAPRRTFQSSKTYVQSM
jgi:hypothetical protein